MTSKKSIQQSKKGTFCIEEGKGVGYYLRTLFLLILLIFFFVYGAFSQGEWAKNTFVGVGGHFGNSLPEYPFLTAITNENITSIDLSFSKKTYGNNPWEEGYNFPEMGLSFFHSTLGNNEILGKEWALNYFFKIYWSKKHKIRPFNQIGIGLNYVTQKFDQNSNFLNVAVGSHVNIHFNCRLGLNAILSQKWELNGGLSFDHYSNGNTSEPNLGINNVTAFIGVARSLGERTELVLNGKTEHSAQNSVKIWWGTGGKHTRLLATQFYITQSISADFERSFFRKFSFGIGPDFFYDTSVKNSLETLNQEYRPKDAFQTGMHISQSMVYNRLTLTLQEGLYIGLKEPVHGYPMYNRGIIQYQVSPFWAIRLSMKSHLHILDFPELGIGIKLK